MAQLWRRRSSGYAVCSTTREADPTAATDLHNVGNLSRAPQPCARFISTTISPLSASSTHRYSLYQMEPTDHHIAVFIWIFVHELGRVAGRLVPSDVASKITTANREGMPSS